MKNDSAGRIVRAEDDSGHWVTYEYDKAGWLRKAETWQGETDEFKYDDHFNMIWVGERDLKNPPGEYRFTVTNQFDAKDRFKSQEVDYGTSVDFYSADYHEDATGRIHQTDVRSREGLSYYYFNGAGYEIREDFFPPRGPKWMLEFSRDPNTNAITDTWLSCSNRRIHVLPSISTKLQAMGEGHKKIVSDACAHRMPAQSRQK